MRLVIVDFESIHVTARSLDEALKVVFVTVVKTFIGADIENILVSKVNAAVCEGYFI